MPAPNIPSHSAPSPEVRAFLARLAALNVACEAARAGAMARGLADEAMAVDAMLERFFRALTGSDHTAPAA